VVGVEAGYRRATAAGGRRETSAKEGVEGGLRLDAPAQDVTTRPIRLERTMQTGMTKI